MYHIFHEPKDKELLSGWLEITEGFDLIKGYTDLGDIFLINSQTNEVGILFTMQNSFEPMGFTNWEEFYTTVMNNSDFQRDVVNCEFIEKVKSHCGDLDKEQIYIATPYPCLGGSGAPNTHKKGDIWVYLSMSSQILKQL